MHSYLHGLLLPTLHKGFESSYGELRRSLG